MNRATVARYSGWSRRIARWADSTRRPRPRPEAALPLVEDEGRVVQHVGVAGLERPHAELALLAVPLAEALRVEQPDLVEHLPLDVEADADAGGQARVGAQGALLDQPAEAVHVPAGGQGVGLQEAGERADRGAVRERRDRGDLAAPSTRPPGACRTQPAVTWVSLLSRITSRSEADIPRLTLTTNPCRSGFSRTRSLLAAAAGIAPAAADRRARPPAGRAPGRYGRAGSPGSGRRPPAPRRRARSRRRVRAAGREGPGGVSLERQGNGTHGRRHGITVVLRSAPERA